MRKEVKLGALVLVVLAIMIWGFNFLKGKDVFANSITLTTHYTDVGQLSASAPIIINGVRVGNVTDVSLDPKDVNNVIVTFNIDDVDHVPKTATAVLTSIGIMGGKAIVVDFDGPCTGDGCLRDGDFIQGKELGLIPSILGEGTLDSYVGDAQKKIASMMGGEEGQEEIDFRVMIDDLTATMANLNDITRKINSVLAASTYDVKNVTENLSKLSNTLNANNDKITGILTNVEAVTQDLKNANIAQTVNKANETLGGAESAIADLKKTINTTNSSMGKITELVDKVERGEGSLGMLVNDKELYNELESASEEIALLLQDLRLNPKRYVNVSVFGKKQKEYVLPEDDPANKMKENK